MKEEDELIERIASGDETAYGDVYTRYSEPLYRFLSFRIPQRDDVEDLVSSVFLKVFEALREGKRIRHVRAFLYQVARNSIADYYRLRARQREFEMHLGEEGNEREVVLYDENDIRITIGEMKDALMRIKPEYQEIVILRYIEEMEFEEIAVALNKSYGAARVLLHRALKALKKSFHPVTTEHGR